MNNNIFIISIIVFGSVGIVYGKDGIQHETSVALFSAGIAAIAQKLYDFLPVVKAWRQIAWLWVQNKPLRISFAALIKIKSGNEYLLVKSNRIKHQWQPVGGVYQFYDKNLIDGLGLRDDEVYRDSPPNEFRLEFPPKKVFNAFNLEKWFEQKRCRETSPHREFYEELLETGILNKDLFSVLNFQFLKSERIYSFSKEFDKQELKIFEVFEFLPSVEQDKEIEKLKHSNNGSVVFLDRASIEKGGIVEPGKREFPVGGHTEYIL